MIKDIETLIQYLTLLLVGILIFSSCLFMGFLVKENQVKKDKEIIIEIEDPDDLKDENKLDYIINTLKEENTIQLQLKN